MSDEDKLDIPTPELSYTPEPPAAVTVMSLRLPMLLSICSFCSLMPCPIEIIRTMEQQPTITPSTVKIVRDLRRSKFCAQVCAISENRMPTP